MANSNEFGLQRYVDLLNDKFSGDLVTAITAAGHEPVSTTDLEALWGQWFELSNREIRTDLTSIGSETLDDPALLDPNVLGKYVAVELGQPTDIGLVEGKFGDEFHLEVNHNGHGVTFSDGISSTSVTSIGHALDVDTDFTLYTFLMTSDLGGSFNEWVLVAAKDFVK